MKVRINLYGTSLYIERVPRKISRGYKIKYRNLWWLCRYNENGVLEVVDCLGESVSYKKFLNS